MSDDENVSNTVESTVEQTVESTKNAAGNVLASVLSLKEKNPKVFFGAIGGVVLLLVLTMVGGGSSDKVLTGQSIKQLAVGQKYVLKSPNTFDQNATVKIANVPGAIAAYDDSEEEKAAPCLRLPQGTPVSVLDFQNSDGVKNAFVKVQIEDGECKGSLGWALAIDVQ
jgi:hypothetical protein